MTGLTDVHCHLLWGMDDGARDEAEALAMLRRAAGQGILRIVATPHVSPGVRDFDLALWERRLEEARRLCAREGLKVEIYGGAELFYTQQTCRLLAQGRAPTLAGTEYALVEFSPDVRWERLREALLELRRWGFLPVLAHAERYACLRLRPARLDELRAESEPRFQINASSVLRPRGLPMRAMLRRMLARGLVDFVASDAHRAEPPRCANLREAWQALSKACGAEEAQRLTDGHLLFAGGAEAKKDAKGRDRRCEEV